MQLKVGQKVKVEIGGKSYEIERINQYLVKITNEDKQWLGSIDGDVEVDTRYAFHELPYFFRFSNPLTAAPKTLLKLFVKLPLVKKLVVRSNVNELTIHRHMESERKIWHGEVYEGQMCIHVEPEIITEPGEGEFANIPIRFSNKSNDVLGIKKFVLQPDYLILYQGKNGLYTNKVYVDIIGENEVRVTYGQKTTNKAGSVDLLVEQKTKPQKSILTKFTPMMQARYFGL